MSSGLMNKLFLLSSLVVGVAVVAVVAIVMIGPGSPFGGVATVLAKGPAEGAASEFLKDLQNGQVDEAYGKTTKAFQQHLSLDEFRDLIKAYPGLKGCKMPGLQARDLATEQVTFRATLEGADGSTLDIVLEVSAKESGGWKVNRFTIWKREKR